jgi:hypothetical protein
MRRDEGASFLGKHGHQRGVDHLEESEDVLFAPVLPLIAGAVRDGCSSLTHAGARRVRLLHLKRCLVAGGQWASILVPATLPAMHLWPSMVTCSRCRG